MYQNTTMQRQVSHASASQDDCGANPPRSPFRKGSSSTSPTFPIREPVLLIPVKASVLFASSQPNPSPQSTTPLTDSFAKIPSRTASPPQSCIPRPVHLRSKSIANVLMPPSTFNSPPQSPTTQKNESLLKPVFPTKPRPRSRSFSNRDDLKKYSKRPAASSSPATKETQPRQNWQKELLAEISRLDSKIAGWRSPSSSATTTPHSKPQADNNRAGLANKIGQAKLKQQSSGSLSLSRDSSSEEPIAHSSNSKTLFGSSSGSLPSLPSTDTLLAPVFVQSAKPNCIINNNTTNKCNANKLDQTPDSRMRTTFLSVPSSPQPPHDQTHSHQFHIRSSPSSPEPAERDQTTNTTPSPQLDKPKQLNPHLASLLVDRVGLEKSGWQCSDSDSCDSLEMNADDDAERDVAVLEDDHTHTRAHANHKQQSNNIQVGGMAKQITEFTSLRVKSIDLKKQRLQLMREASEKRRFEALFGPDLEQPSPAWT